MEPFFGDLFVWSVCALGVGLGMVLGRALEVRKRKRHERGAPKPRSPSRVEQDDWRTLADASEDLMGIVDASGRVLRANRAFIERAQIEPGALGTIDLAQRLRRRGEPPEPGPIELSQQTRRMCIATTGPSSLGTRLKVTALPMLDTVGFLLRDVSGPAEAADQSRRLEHLVDALPIAVVAVQTANNRVTLVNQAFLDAFRLDEAGAREIVLEQLVVTHPGSTALSLRDAAFTGDRRPRLLEMRRADESVFFARVHATLHRRASGAPDTIVLLVEDITKEREVARQREMLAAAIEGTKDGVVMTDRVGLITFANAAAGVLYGCEMSEMIGRSFAELHGPGISDGSGARPMFDERLDVDSSYTGDLPRTTPGQGRRPTRVALSAVRQEGYSHATGFVAVVQDLTEEHELRERALRSEKLATLGELAAAINHEIGNPLSYLLVNTKMLKEELAVRPDLAELESMAADCFDGVRRIASIVSDVRRFAHMGQSGPTLNRLTDAIDAALSLAGALVRQHEVVRPDAPGPWVMVDQGHLTQVVLNLVVNAAQALTAAGKHGTIRFEHGTSDGRAWLRVIDDGPGIPDTIVARLFRDYVTTKAKGEGTGFGLRISAKLIEGMGGRLEVETKLGTGTQFSISLPLACELDSVNPPVIRPLRASIEALA